MENAEVLEMTVKKVEDVLKNRSQGQNQNYSRMRVTEGYCFYAAVMLKKQIFFS